MNQIVFMSEDFGANQIRNLEYLEVIILIVILIVLFYEFFKIFIPVNKKLISNIKNLKEKDKTIEHQAKFSLIGELSASIGHEIYNPLSVVAGANKIIKKEVEKLDQSDIAIKFLDKSEIAISRIGQIINNLRKFSRMDKDEIEVVELNKIVEDNIDFMEPILSKKSISFSFERAAEDISLNLNKGKLNQIMVNLFANARDAMKNSSAKEIKIRTEIAEGCAQLRVSDTGHGIPNNLKEKIFESYFTTKGEGEGTGLGLGLVKQYIKQMNGEIKVESSSSMGTTFLIVIPLYNT